LGLIYFDACLVIYLEERHPQWSPQLAKRMSEAADARFAISPLVKFECLVGPIKRADPVLHKSYLELFDRFETLEIPEAVYLDAAALRARFGLKAPDAIHLACAQHHGCDALWTNDNRLGRASHGLSRNVLR
jgi:predicted nucleic acid-binding protein